MKITKVTITPPSGESRIFPSLLDAEKHYGLVRNSITKSRTGQGRNEFDKKIKLIIKYGE